MQVGDYTREGDRWYQHQGFAAGMEQRRIMPEGFEPGEGCRIYDPTKPLHSTHAPGTKPPNAHDAAYDPDRDHRDEPPYADDRGVGGPLTGSEPLDGNS